MPDLNGALSAPVAARGALTVALAAVVALTGWSTPADASGFASARFGGEEGNPVEKNPSALYYNPGGIGFARKTHVMLDLNLVWRDGSYNRPESAVDSSSQALGAEAIAVNSGEGNVNNFLMAPMIGVTSDLGLDLPLVVGGAFYVPFGGQSTWDRNGPESSEYAGALDGPQRWYVTDGTIRTMAATVGAAYRIEPIRLSLGLAGNALFSSVNTLRARNGDKTDNPASEGRSLVDVSSTDWSLGVGALWEPVEDTLWLGLSYQSRPNLTGDMVMEGKLQQLIGAAPEERDVKFYQTLPDILRFGAKLKPAPKVELRLFGDVTFWSVFERQCVVSVEVADDAVADTCAVDANGALLDANNSNDVEAVLVRNWKNAIGVRAGASFWPMRGLELLGGAGYDASAVPDETLEPGLMDLDKVSASLGVKYRFIPELALMVTGTNIFYLENDTTGVTTAEGLTVNNAPTVSRQPSSAGVYNQNIFLLNTNLQIMF